MYTRYDISNRDDYYEQFTIPKSIIQFQQWREQINHADNVEIINSGRDFRFWRIDFGSSKKILYQKNGKPRFIRNGGLFGDKKHEIAFYKEVQNDQKLISQLHFLDDFFFYGCHTFRYLSREKFPLIKKVLAEKYELTEGFFDTGKIIVDRNNNQIRLIDNVFLNLIYFSGDENIKSMVDHYVTHLAAVNKKQQKGILMDLYGLL